jgi:hypothetical protein
LTIDYLRHSVDFIVPFGDWEKNPRLQAKTSDGQMRNRIKLNPKFEYRKLFCAQKKTRKHEISESTKS